VYTLGLLYMVQSQAVTSLEWADNMIAIIKLQSLHVHNDLILMTSLDFFNLPNPSSCTMVLGLAPPLTEMSARNHPGGKVQPARKVICVPTVYKMWIPRCLTTL
jgi:hypothetical protein